MVNLTSVNNSFVFQQNSFQSPRLSKYTTDSGRTSRALFDTSAVETQSSITLEPFYSSILEPGIKPRCESESDVGEQLVYNPTVNPQRKTHSVRSSLE